MSKLSNGFEKVLVNLVDYSSKFIIACSGAWMGAMVGLIAGGALGTITGAGIGMLLGGPLGMTVGTFVGSQLGFISGGILGAVAGGYLIVDKMVNEFNNSKEVSKNLNDEKSNSFDIKSIDMKYLTNEKKLKLAQKEYLMQNIKIKDAIAKELMCEINHIKHMSRVKGKELVLSIKNGSLRAKDKLTVEIMKYKSDVLKKFNMAQKEYIEVINKTLSNNKFNKSYIKYITNKYVNRELKQKFYNLTESTTNSKEGKSKVILENINNNSKDKNINSVGEVPRL